MGGRGKRERERDACFSSRVITLDDVFSAEGRHRHMACNGVCVGVCVCVCVRMCVCVFVCMCGSMTVARQQVTKFYLDIGSSASCGGRPCLIWAWKEREILNAPSHGSPVTIYKTLHNK